MEQIVRMLEKPQRYFTAHASWYGVVQTYTVSEITPFFWEDECVMFYVRSGSGFLRVNQTLYPLSQGCFCSMHQFHVFRFEASSEEPLCMEVLIYPYPEMAYFVTSRRFRQLFHAHTVVQSFSNSWRPHDNAVAEPFSATLKQEELYRKDYTSEADFKQCLASCIEYIELYNTQRPHRTLKNRIPCRVEEAFMNSKSGGAVC